MGNLNCVKNDIAKKIVFRCKHKKNIQKVEEFQEKEKYNYVKSEYVNFAWCVFGLQSCVHYAVVTLEEYYMDSVALWCPRKFISCTRRKKKLKADLGLNPGVITQSFVWEAACKTFLWKFSNLRMKMVCFWIFVSFLQTNVPFLCVMETGKFILNVQREEKDDTEMNFVPSF